MQRFMQDKNLSLFLRRLLAEQKQMTEERRQVILELLADEEAKVGRVSPWVSVMHARIRARLGQLLETSIEITRRQLVRL